MKDRAIDVLPGIPPTAVAAATFLGLSPDQWVQLLSIAWLLLLIIRALRDEFVKWRKARRARKAPRRRSSDIGGMRATNPRMHRDPADDVRRHAE